jgi:hypothetical protein
MFSIRTWFRIHAGTALRQQANDAAFRFLKRALPLFVTAYWTVYLWAPVDPIRFRSPAFPCEAVLREPPLEHCG